MTLNTRLRLLLASFFLLGTLLAAYAQLSGVGAIRASIFDGPGLIEGLNTAQGEIGGTGIREDADLVVIIADIINFILLFAGIFALVAFIVAGFMFILGFGSDSSIQRAKKIMIWAAVGLVVIIFAFTIVNFIVDLAM